MDDIAREEYEHDLAIAIMLLWIFFDTQSKTRPIDFAQFLQAFDQHVRPILSRVYGNARNELANRFGFTYPIRQDGGTAIVQIPGLNRAIDQYAQDVFARFQGRRSKWEQIPEEERPEAPAFTDSDADGYAVTNITEVNSHGEHDAARDVESRIGTRLVPVWSTEPGACKVCAPLEGSGSRVWRHRFPMGPPAHPRCRCRLIWRPLI